MQRKVQRGFSSVFVLLAAALSMVVAAYGGNPTPTPNRTAARLLIPTATLNPTPEPGAPKPVAEPIRLAAQSKEVSFQKKWQQLITAAQREGRVNVMMGGAARRQYRPALKAFGKKFGVRVSALGGSTTDLANRILAERGAGRFTQDIALGGGALERRFIPAGALDDIEPNLIHPEVLDKSLWAGGQFWFRDMPETNKIFLYSGDVSATGSDPWYNTKLMTEKDFADLTSIYDWLDPKWRGKIATGAPLSGGGGVMGDDCLRFGVAEFCEPLFKKQNIMWIVNVRTLVDTIIRGVRPVGVLNMGKAGTELQKASEQGLPVAKLHVPASKWKEPSVLAAGSSTNNIAIMNDAPHPNAAKLFLNWWLSKDGQTTVMNTSKALTDPTMRADIPLGKRVNPNLIPAREVKKMFYPRAQPGFAEKQKKFDQIAIDLYRKLR